MKRGTIGIVREVYSKWERRSPLTPGHVEKIVQDGTRVLVQPCTKRIFSNREFQNSGAVITDDLSEANAIFGVKQVKKEALLEGKSYCFFSHVIKAQEVNMPLLDEVLKRNIRLFDYECITDNERRRLVAFGKYAGKAGMINAFRGLGDKMIDLGYSTPFTSIGSAYMYPSYDTAIKNLEEAGASLKNLDDSLLPLVFVFTGSGKVTQGALEVFETMPSIFCDVEDLPSAVQQARSRGIPIVASTAKLQDMVRRVEDGGFDKTEYYGHPERYQPVFADNVGKFVDVIVNGSYWDSRFPRHVKFADILAEKFPKLKVIADLSCDVNGGIELLTDTTTIESPFLNVENVCVLGVDILPSELPREASQHFGDVLMPFVDALAQNTETAKLPSELSRALIADQGRLRPDFEYIQKLRLESERAKLSRTESGSIPTSRSVALQGTAVFSLTGHMFDSGLINKCLDVIEHNQGVFHIAECFVRPHQKSTIVLQVTMPGGRQDLDSIEADMRQLLANEQYGCADASLAKMPESYCSGNYTATLSAFNFEPENDETSLLSDPPSPLFSGSEKVVTILGSGMVAGPAVEYLSRDKGCLVRVVSNAPGEAKNLCQHKSLADRRNVEGRTTDVMSDLSQLVEESDCLLSLLPQPFHVTVAKECIQKKTPLVTASYVSKEMSALDIEAKENGIPILCEMGLDPGMDHMSAMQIIDRMKRDGRELNSFSSLCGGLPAPEAANNIFGYKFSWSPKGVLTALSNDARYRKDGQLIEIEGADLLKHAKPFKLHNTPSFALEHLPNRDSMVYANSYGIETAKTVYRGTLRYEGFCSHMASLQKLGFFQGDSRFDTVLQSVNTANLSQDLKRLVQKIESTASKESLSMLAIDGFCQFLQGELAYGEEERDMVLMQHTFNENQEDELVSSLIVYGDEDASAMAKTVGVTAAIGVKLVLEDMVEYGVVVPTKGAVYNPCLELLEKEGFVFEHH